MKRDLRIDLSYENKIPIISLGGQLTSMKQEQLFQTYKDISQSDVRKVILDFGDIEHINSSGISVLIQLIRDSKLRQASFVFTDLNPHLQRVFDSVGLTEVIPIHATIKEALAES